MTFLFTKFVEFIIKNQVSDFFTCNSLKDYILERFVGIVYDRMSIKSLSKIAHLLFQLMDVEKLRKNSKLLEPLISIIKVKQDYWLASRIGKREKIFNEIFCTGSSQKDIIIAMAEVSINPYNTESLICIYNCIYTNNMNIWAHRLVHNDILYNLFMIALKNILREYIALIR